MILAIDPGASSGLALLHHGVVIAVRQVVAPAHAADHASLWRQTFATLAGAASVVVIEDPCYSANQARRTTVSAHLGERVGEWRGLAWAAGLPVVMAPWATWQGWAHRGLHGTSEQKSLERALMMGIRREALTGPKGAILFDAATACCIGGWYQATRGER